MRSSAIGDGHRLGRPDLGRACQSAAGRPSPILNTFEITKAMVDLRQRRLITKRLMGVLQVGLVVVALQRDHFVAV